MAHEDFALFDRLLGTGTTPRLAVTIANTLTRDSVTQWNTVAEIPGREHPGQVVIVGAHLDSWDLGAGATDNGTGAITGQALQGRTDLEALWRAILAPVANLGADSVVNRTKGGTDHLSFLPYGVPGFNFNQLERGYNHTHHSQSDTYDMAIPADLMQASAVMAVSAFELANLPGMIPRGERTAPTPVQAVKVSDSLLVTGKGRN